MNCQTNLTTNRPNAHFKRLLEPQDDLMTPYFRRSMSSKHDTELLKLEADIEHWLTERDIRLVTPETIGYEQQSKCSPLAFSSNQNTTNACPGGNSSPARDSLTLKMQTNSLFLKRRQMALNKENVPN